MPILPAAIAIILNSDQTEVLLVKRRDIPIWVLPGGGIEINESPLDALKREIREETGYEVKILRQCAEYFSINRLTSTTSVFICEIESGQMRLSEETADIRFYSIQKLPMTFFFAHAQWLNEALCHSNLIQRPLTEVSYSALCKYFIRRPWQVLRFAWTRFVK